MGTYIRFIYVVAISLFSHRRSVAFTKYKIKLSQVNPQIDSKTTWNTIAHKLTSTFRHRIDLIAVHRSIFVFHSKIFTISTWAMGDSGAGVDLLFRRGFGFDCFLRDIMLRTEFTHLIINRNYCTHSFGMVYQNNNWIENGFLQFS